ncbi:tumor necrosis factor receptor superfamily member 6 [Pithys albifrons albifrons]|uniref:tumor necrosis factor receptor superfamily member 6 n=1 Tax=Pithys albifrons albifrons TaxID=3385563 RepID=UPI003A5CBF66
MCPCSFRASVSCLTLIGKVPFTNTHFEGLLSTGKVSALIIEAQCKNYTEALMHGVYNRRIIAKRDTMCKQDEYDLDGQCCKKCNSGFVKNTGIACPTDISKHCVACESGKEFMNHPNDLSKCKRCRLCDRVFGLEVAKNCTPEKDTECACAKNHFCNISSGPCGHCNPCTICESDVIERQCTSTSDTVCGIKETGMPSWAIALLVVLVLAIPGVIFWWKRKQRSLTTKENPSEVEASYENVPLIDLDADLSNHIPDIVKEMTLPEVLAFVRHHHVQEPTIDQITRDCAGDTSEQKIKLFGTWYQHHGMKGACGTLISSLRQLKMCAAADKIEGKLKAAFSSRQEGRQSYKGDTEQS